jgi:hypothetical protein
MGDDALDEEIRVDAILRDASEVGLVEVNVKSKHIVSFDNDVLITIALEPSGFVLFVEFKLGTEAGR